MEPTALILVLAVVLIGGAIALTIWGFGSHFNEKAVVRNSLRQLEGYEVENVRDQELLAPITERAIMPVLGGLTSLGRRFTPVGYVDSVRRKTGLRTRAQIGIWAFIWLGVPGIPGVD